jgi:hypothetical protein
MEIGRILKERKKYKHLKPKTFKIFKAFQKLK